MPKKKKIKEVSYFIGNSKKDTQYFCDSFKKPTNVTIPKNIFFTKKQNKIFGDICEAQMIRYNYGQIEYEVKY